MSYVEFPLPVSATYNLPYRFFYAFYMFLLLRKSSVAPHCLLINSQGFTLIFESPYLVGTAYFPLNLSGAFPPVCLAPHPPRFIEFILHVPVLWGTMKLFHTLNSLIPLSGIPCPQPTAQIPPPFPTLPEIPIFHVLV